MIDTRELRLGNCIIVNGSTDRGVMCKVVSVYSGFVHIDSSKTSSPCDKGIIFPVPITAELLLNCGFTYNAIDDCFDRLNIRVRILGYSICAFIGFEVGFGKEWHDANIEIKSLHQLQNLYFSLIGKELEVNL